MKLAGRIRSIDDSRNGPTDPQCGDLSFVIRGETQRIPLDSSLTAGDMSFFEVRIDDIFHVAGQGLVMAGTVTQGEIRLADRVSIKTPSTEIRSVVHGIEIDKKFVERASTNQNVCVVFSSVAPEDLVPGVEPAEGGGWSVLDIVLHQAPPRWWEF